MWFIAILFVSITSVHAECPSAAPCILVRELNEEKFSPRPAPTIVEEMPEEVSETDELDLITFARGFIGTPYQYGGESQNGIDCSAFIQKVFREFHINLPRTSREQYRFYGSVNVSLHDLQPNDLLFFKTESGNEIDHVALYIGDGKMIHSSKMEDGVQVTDFKFSKFWSSRFASAKRITKENL